MKISFNIHLKGDLDIERAIMCAASIATLLALII